MTATDRLFERLVAKLPTVTPVGALVVPVIVAAWLRDGPRVFGGADRQDLEALCRQIDVRRTISIEYRTGWKRMDPERPADAGTVAGLVAVLLANSGPIDGFAGSIHAASDDGGWGLKCVNSALKALDHTDGLPAAPELRAWALTILDQRTGSTT